MSQIKPLLPKNWRELSRHLLPKTMQQTLQRCDVSFSIQLTSSSEMGDGLLSKTQSDGKEEQPCSALFSQCSFKNHLRHVEK